MLLGQTKTFPRNRRYKKLPKQWLKQELLFGQVRNSGLLVVVFFPVGTAGGSAVGVWLSDKVGEFAGEAASKASGWIYDKISNGEAKTLFLK